MLGKGWTRVKQLSPAVKASLCFAVSSMLQKGISLITVPLFTRLLTTEQYGQFTLYQSWLSLVTIFATLYLYYGVFNNGMTKYKQDRQRYIAAMQGLSTVATLVVFAVYAVAMPFWENLLQLPRVVILFMFVEMLFSPAMQYWSARQRYEFKYKALTVVTVTMSLANPLLGLLAVHLTAEKGIARILSASLVNAVFGLAFYCLNFARGKTFYQAQYWKFALGFNIPLIPHYLAQMVLSQSDRLMIGKMFGETPVAIYGLACSLGMVMAFVTGSINNSFIPWTYQQCDRQAYDELGRKSNLLVLFVGGIALLPAIAAPEIVYCMAPSAYRDAIWIIPPIALSNYIVFLYSLFANVEFYFEENKFVMAASCMAAAANLVLNFLCMPRFGYIAAAYTTVICYVLLAVGHYLFMKRILRKNGVQGTIYPIRTMVLFTAALTGVMLGIQLLYPYPAVRYGVVAVAAVGLFIKRKAVLAFVKSITKEKQV